MPKKHALLIANTEYRDGKLAPLSHPGLAYAELAEALKDPARGAFSQVETLVNANLSHVLNTLDRFFSRKPADDVLLVYVGAHGFVDSQGELFLALKESDRFRLKSTALMAAVLGMNMDQCPSPHKLLILDCRIHSPYQDPRGPHNALRYDPARIFAGRGLPKRILSAAEPQPAAAAPAPPASSTQKVPVTAPKTLTRVLAETFRTPSGAGAARAAFTVEEWWNDAAAELKASKAEPPLRHDVGAPPVTVLRGTSLPRQELALSSAVPGREPTAALPALSPAPEAEAEAEAEWSRLSGIFPLEMFAPALAAGAAEPEAVHPPLRPAAEAAGAEAADAETIGAETAGADAGAAGTLAEAAETSGTIAEAAEAEIAERTVMMAAPRGDQTIVADLNSFVEGADFPAPTAPPPGPRDTFTDLRARLRSQEEEERRARLEAEREEAAQREKLSRWKARWEMRTREKDGRGPNPDAETLPGAGGKGPETAPPAEPAQGKPDRNANRNSYRGKIAALQKTLYVPPPDAASETDAPRQAPPPQVAAPPQAGFQDGTATVMVSKDQFLNTGSHKPPTQLVPGATIHISREEFLGNRAAPHPAPSADQAKPAPSPASQPAARETSASARPQPASLSPKPGRDAGPDGDGTRVAHAVTARRGGAKTRPRVPPPPRVPGAGRRKVLWALAGLVPVGLCLLLYFGTQAGLFWSLGLGPDPAAARAEQSRAAAMRFPDEVAAADEEGVILPAESAAAQNPPASAPAAPAGTSAPAAPVASQSASATAPAAAPAAEAHSSAAVPGSPDPAPTRSQAPAAAAPAKPRPAAPAVTAAPAASPAPPKPAPGPTAGPEARAARAAQEAERLARAQYRQDSLRAYRVYRDSLLTARAQAMQDSIQQSRLLREQERARRAEAETARLAAARLRQDSLRAVKDSVQAETLLRKTVNQALKAGTPELRSLYNRFALGYPGLQGEVVVELLVAPDGEIEKGALRSSTTGNKMFDQLVLGNVMEWRMRPFKSREPKAVLVALNFPIAP